MFCSSCKENIESNIFKITFLISDSYPKKIKSLGSFSFDKLK